MSTLVERMAPYLDYDLELAHIGVVPCPSLCRATLRAMDGGAISVAERWASTYLYKCEQFAYMSIPDMHIAHKQWAEKLLAGIDNSTQPVL